MGRCHSSGTRQASVTCHSCRTLLSRRSRQHDAAATPCRTSRNTGDTGVQHSDRAQHVTEHWRHRVSTLRPCPDCHGTLETQGFNMQTAPSMSRNSGDTGVQHSDVLETQGFNMQTAPSTSRNTGDTGGQQSDRAQHVMEHWKHRGSTIRPCPARHGTLETQGVNNQTVPSTSRNIGDTWVQPETYIYI